MHGCKVFLRKDSRLAAGPSVWDDVLQNCQGNQWFGVGNIATMNDAYAELAGLLTEAAAVIDSLSELNVYCPFDTPAEFSARVRELAGRVRGHEHVALRELIPLFSPTGAWDDAIGPAGMNLANRIDGLLDQLRWNAEPHGAPDTGREIG
jgi:hypothetical protein